MGMEGAEEMRSAGSSVRFHATLWALGGFYLFLIVAMIGADLLFTTPGHLWAALQSEEIQYAVKLSLVSCTVTAMLSLWVAVPLGYLLSRQHFPGKLILDTILDVPIVLPPLVIGLSLLILFQTRPGKWLEWVTAKQMGFTLTYICLPLLVSLISWPLVGAKLGFARGFYAMLFAGLLILALLLFTPLGPNLAQSLQKRFGTAITFGVPSVILAQFSVSCAFAVRTMRVTFDQISPRTEMVALTLGCTRSQAFWLVSLPEAWRGLVTAASLAWARALGEFGPILIFSGATRMRTEVLSTTVFLELSGNHLEAAIAVSLLMVMVAVGALLVMRALGLRGAV